jgi:hypothetical protein
MSETSIDAFVTCWHAEVKEAGINEASFDPGEV